MATGNIFYDILKAEYNKRVPIDAVALKRNKFKGMIDKAYFQLSHEMYKESTKEFFGILELIESDPYPDEFLLNPEEKIWYSCCYCYSFVMGLDHTAMPAEPLKADLNKKTLECISNKYPNWHFTKYLQVLNAFKKSQWLLALYFCQTLLSSLNEKVEQEKCFSLFGYNESIIPETNPVKCSDKLKTIEQCCFFSAIEDLSNADNNKNISQFFGLRWLEIWSKEFGDNIMKKFKSLKNPIGSMKLHTIFHHDIMDLYYTKRNIYFKNGDVLDVPCWYFNPKYLNTCEECLRSKLMQDNYEEMQKIKKGYAHEYDTNFGKVKIMQIDFCPKDKVDVPVELSGENGITVSNKDVCDTQEKSQSKKKKRKKKNVSGENTEINKPMASDKSKICDSDAKNKENKSSFVIGSGMPTFLKVNTNIETSGVKETTLMKTGQTQTEKPKLGNRYVQTEGVSKKNVMLQTEPPKRKNIEVQVDVQDLANSEVLNTVLHIKNTLMNENNRKNSVKLEDKISELYKRLKDEQNLRRNVEKDLNEKTIKYELEIKQLKEALNKNEREKEVTFQKNVILQKLIVEQVNDKFNMHKNIYKELEKRSKFMVLYLNEIGGTLTAKTVPHIQEIKFHQTCWEGVLRKIQNQIEIFKIFYKHIKSDMIHSNKFEINDWPEIPEIPGEEFNFVFNSFKRSITHNIELEKKIENVFRPSQSNPQPNNPQVPFAENNQIQMQCLKNFNPYMEDYPNIALHNMHNRQNTSTNGQHSYQQPPVYFRGQRLVCPVLPPPISMPSASQVPSFHPAPENHNANTHSNNSCLQENVKHSVAAAPISKPKHFNRAIDEIKVMASACQPVRTKEMRCHKEEAQKKGKQKNFVKDTAASIKKQYTKEDMLYEFITSHCSNSPEGEVISVLFQVLDKHNGTFSNVPKETILEEVKFLLRSVTKHSPWGSAKSANVIDWQNDHSDNCTICFEEILSNTEYALPCKHEYHKKCIMKWLKTNSICPICRLPAVIDEEFPPL